MDNNLLYKIALSKIPGIGSVLAKNLVGYCGGARAVFSTSRKKLLQIPSIGPKITDAILKADTLQTAEKELSLAEKHDIEIIDHLDKRYPARLKHLPSSPYVLYMKGKTTLNYTRTVAIVGTRKPTPRGENICKALVQGLKQYDVSIISGLAYGIDVMAHKESLKQEVPTIGVMGNGFGRIYPAQHIKVARSMVDSGALVTEFGYNVGPDRENFPARNRIIAGMSDVIIVVESASKGGSMITAIFGNEYNKDVFAIPGRPQDPYSEGCNYLIKVHKANLCETAEDIGYVMGWEKKSPTESQRSLFVELPTKEKQLLEIIKTKENPTIDLLSYESQIPQSELSTLLLSLEFKGLIKTLPGKRFIMV
ncbi:MAG: DNA-processing protein DprA [Bacteroidia bacterium]|nr:DNA-processing protein DprA [Bacteroidia bacterium]